MPSFRIQTQAPTRIDLSGGTLDIWPLYLFLPQSVTVNLAIDLFAQVKIEYTPHPSELKACLYSKDQNTSCEVLLHSPQEREKAQQALPLLANCLNYFYDKALKNIPTGHFNITTQAQSPSGAGLGGSSSLAIAFCAALFELCAKLGLLPQRDFQNNEDHKQELIKLVSDLESQVLKIPAGLQDYYAAVYGGLQAIFWKPLSHEQIFFFQKIPLIKAFLNTHLSLYYSGQSRNSGINNWEVFSDFINQKTTTQKHLTQIHIASQNLAKTLRELPPEGPFEKIFPAIQQEWQARIQLAPQISTPQINAFFDYAKRQNCPAMKICGAGGGGCFFIASTSLEQKQKLQAFSSEQIQPLNFHACETGLQIHYELMPTL
jgi:D-glycero-alpha-D-manno-heptose-7-phosphate kinase